MFPYKICTEWLRDQAQRLEASGCKVEIVDNELQLPTYRLKVSSNSLLADLVVWQYGRSAMQVFDLQSKKFVLEKHDVELSADGFRQEMQEFFDQIIHS